MVNRSRSKLRFGFSRMWAGKMGRTMSLRSSRRTSREFTATWETPISTAIGKTLSRSEGKRRSDCSPATLLTGCVQSAEGTASCSHRMFNIGSIEADERKIPDEDRKLFRRAKGAESQTRFFCSCEQEGCWLDGCGRGSPQAMPRRGCVPLDLKTQLRERFLETAPRCLHRPRP